MDFYKQKALRDRLLHKDLSIEDMRSMIEQQFADMPTTDALHALRQWRDAVMGAGEIVSKHPGILGRLGYGRDCDAQIKPETIFDRIEKQCDEFLNKSDKEN